MAATAWDMTEPLDTRVTRLESDVAHIRSDVADIKIDLRQMRGEISNLASKTQDGFTAIRAEIQASSAAGRADLAALRREINRRGWAFATLMISLCVAMLGVMARGFGWLH